MKRKIVTFSILLSFFIFPLNIMSTSTANDCTAERNAYNAALMKGVSTTYQEQAYENCIRGLNRATPQQSQLTPCQEAERQFGIAMGSGDISAAATYAQAMRACNASAAAASAAAAIGAAASGGSSGGSSGGCNYKGVAYSSCADANAQYQKDLAEYNAKQQAAAQPQAATKWTCGGQTFNTKAEADAYCRLQAELRCKSPPLTPVVTVSTNELGIALSVEPIKDSEKIENVYVMMSELYKVGNYWGSWSEWKKFTFNNSNFVYQIKHERYFSKVKFIAVAQNSCGNSNQVRESKDLKGIDITTSLIIKAAADKAAADKAAADKAAADKAAESLVQQIAAAAKVAQVKKTNISCIKGNLTKKITAVNPKCPSGYKKK